jgi:hypothetical protein
MDLSSACYARERSASCAVTAEKLTPLLMIVGFCSFSAHDRQELLTHLRILQLCSRSAVTPEALDHLLGLSLNPPTNIG